LNHRHIGAAVTQAEVARRESTGWKQSRRQLLVRLLWMDDDATTTGLRGEFGTVWIRFAYSQNSAQQRMVHPAHQRGFPLRYPMKRTVVKLDVFARHNVGLVAAPSQCRQQVGVRVSHGPTVLF